MTIHPVAWLFMLLALVGLAIVGLCQIGRSEARRKRHVDLVLRQRYGDDEWAEKGIGREDKR